MKCVICRGEDIQEKEVEEEIRKGQDIILLPVRALVCSQCGERYYNRSVMKYLEDAEDNLSQKELVEVGKVKKVV